MLVSHLRFCLERKHQPSLRPAGISSIHGNRKSYKQGANLKDEAKTSSRAYTQGTLKRTLFLVYLEVLP